jgi:hypothetical protein
MHDFFEFICLTSGRAELTIGRTCRLRGVTFAMPSLQPQRKPEPSVSGPINQRCRHPRVQIVAREEDTEFVECIDCREVFESSEFKDMDIEDSFAEDA